MNEAELYYQLALLKAPKINLKLTKVLLEHFKSATNLFHAQPKDFNFLKPDYRAKIKNLKDPTIDCLVQQEMDFIKKNKIQVITEPHPSYPNKLKQCPDAPHLLFYTGNTGLNNKKSIAIIGTRTPTQYGLQITTEVIKQLSQLEILIVSGMANGIDTQAHKEALKNELNTIGVLAHGLDTIYPSGNFNLAQSMLQQGGLLTEYPIKTTPEKYNFPMRNRIVAGMTDAIIVIETAIKGGAMITAKLACSYDKEVFAIPGRVTDKFSEGCNYLIQTNIAHSINNGEDVLNLLGWEVNQHKKSKTVQSDIFQQLNDQEKALLHLLQDKDHMHIDEIQIKLNAPYSHLANTILQLELKQIISPLPGKRYKIN